jgi:hypothetical protein
MIAFIAASTDNESQQSYRRAEENLFMRFSIVQVDRFSEGVETPGSIV